MNPTSGNVTVDNYDIINDYRETRSRIGLVPQELTLEQFETVFNNVSYSRGLYGKKSNPSHIEKVLRQLSLTALELSQCEKDWIFFHKDLLSMKRY
mgnify:CR=1 FL=1